MALGCVTDLDLEVIDHSEVLNKDSHGLETRWWIEELQLKESDCNTLISGMELNDRLINAAQTVLRKQFPNISGFQNTLRGFRLAFVPIPQECKAVQVLFTGTYMRL